MVRTRSKPHAVVTRMRTRCKAEYRDQTKTLKATRRRSARVNSRVDMAGLVEKGNDQILPRKSRNVYKAMWTKYDDFCLRIPDDDKTPLCDRLLAYFTLLAVEYAPSSLWCHQAALKKKFELQGADLSVFKKTTSLLKSLQKHHAPTKASVFTMAEIHTFFYSCQAEPDVILACNLLIHGGMRRSELAALEWPDITCTESELIVKITKSKTDQAGRGHVFIVADHSNERLSAVKAFHRYRDAVM